MSEPDRHQPPPGAPGIGDEVQALLALTLQAGEPVPRMILPDEAAAVLRCLPPAGRTGPVADLLKEIIHTGRDPRLFTRRGPAVPPLPGQYATNAALNAAVSRGELVPVEGFSGAGGYLRVQQPRVEHRMVTRSLVPAAVVLTDWRTGEVWERHAGGGWLLQAAGETGRPGWLAAVDGPAAPIAEMLADPEATAEQVCRGLRASREPWIGLLYTAEHVCRRYADTAPGRLRELHDLVHAIMAQTELQPHRLVLHITDADLAAESHEADADLTAGQLVRVHRTAATMIRHRGPGWWPYGKAWPSRQALLAETGGVLEHPRPGIAWLADPVSDPRPEVGR